MERLKRIADKVANRYFTWVIKDEADKVGEGVMQKVMRYALSSNSSWWRTRIRRDIFINFPT